MKILGLDPGLRVTGWGVIEAVGSELRFVAQGIVATDPKEPLWIRLAQLHSGLTDIVRSQVPDQAAVEETFVNRNPSSTLKLGQARGVVLLVPAQAGLAIAEYSANLVKKSLVGVGHAAKQQVGAMVAMLLPGCDPHSPDAADALAVAICHAHHAATRRRWQTDAASRSTGEARL